MAWVEQDGAVGRSIPNSPIAVAIPTQPAPVTEADVAKLVAGYEGQSVAEMYLGPGWLDAKGVACLVVIARERTIPQKVAATGQCGLISWLWNNSPSAPFSLGLSVPGGDVWRTRPRWMRPVNDPVVQAIRRNQRFLVLIATARGENSGWFEADYRRLPDGTMTPDARVFAQLFDT